MATRNITPDELGSAASVPMPVLERILSGEMPGMPDYMARIFKSLRLTITEFTDD